MQRAFTYAEGVLDGSILACEYVKDACLRFMDDLQRVELLMINERAQRVIDFVEDLTHSAGVHENKPFILSDWEVFIVVNMYGFFWKLSGKRRFRTVYLEMARKQGKSALVDALGLYHLSFDGEGAAEVLLAANSKEQATEVYKIARNFTRKLDPEGTVFKPFRHDILFGEDESFFKVLASDDKTLDGYNCSCGIVDEYHSAPNSKVRDVLRSSQAMRLNPMLITITTAGFDKSLPCYELRTTCTEILAGVKQDDSLFTMIYTLDEEDDWKDPTVWIKSNPNLHVTVHEDFLHQQVLQARNNPGDEVGVRTKNLNEWMDSAMSWIPDKYVVAATGKVIKENLEGKEVFMGVDLANNWDLTAAAFLVEVDGKLLFKIHYYVPSESLTTRPDKELYIQWAKEKHLTVTPGNVTDYEYITKDILEVEAYCYINQIAYDTYNSRQWAVGATNEGLPLVPFSQAIGNFNKCTKEFERRIMKGDVIMDDNPITRYCLRNVTLRMDVNGNVKPDKQQDKKRIDGVIAALQALAMYQEYAKTYQGKIY